MNKPWDNESTPIINQNEFVDDFEHFVSSVCARNLERRLRHAERLIQRHLEAMDTLSGIATTLDDLYNHLEAAKKENEK